MPWNLLILPLLAGYTFTHFCHVFRFRAQTLDGNRLLLESAAAGLALAGLARVLTDIFYRTRIGALLSCYLDRLLPFPFIGTAVLCVLLGLALPMAINLFIKEEAAKWRSVRTHDNDFLRLFHQSCRDEQTVSVTLKSRKVYCGYVLRTPSLSPVNQFVSILPLASGYRDKDTLQVNLPLDYVEVYRRDLAESDDFAVTFALASVDTASFFNSEAFSILQGSVDAEQDASGPLAPFPAS